MTSDVAMMLPVGKSGPLQRDRHPFHQEVKRGWGNDAGALDNSWQPLHSSQAIFIGLDASKGECLGASDAPEGGIAMAESQSGGPPTISRDRLAELLNEDLSREYQAIISYVVYSQVLSGAQYTDIAAQLEIHAKQELDHALIISRQIDYLGKMPAVTPQPVRTSKNAVDMLRFDLENENETVRNYRDRVRQCEALGEYAMAEQIRQILVQEQDHQIDLATALGEKVPDLSIGPRRLTLTKRR
jgi:bacterioferritin